MGTAFDNFSQYGFGHFPGQVEDLAMSDIVSRVADSSAIGYGLGVIDIDQRSARLPTSSEVSNGITVRETVRDNPAGDKPTPEYPQDHEMSVMRVGRIWVTTVDGATFGDDVYVIPNTGDLTNDAAGGTNIQLPNAAFKSAASAGDVALVQLDGNQ
jgi:hypothetical protein